MTTVSATLQIYDRFTGPLKDFANGIKTAAQTSNDLKNSMANSANGMNFSKPKQDLTELAGQAEKTSGIFNKMLGANIIGAGIVNGIGALKNGISGMMGELSASSATWQTFQANMKQLGASDSVIATAKKDMQDYATQTIYSASDMASTYAQLAAVGTKNTGELVKGFGGLAAASENPAQAMKSLSQQATQMAAKPKIAWEDFKIMLEQSPAGMAAVAREMGISTEDLIKKVQAGTVTTQKFFDAIQKAGTSEGFTKMATEFKTVDQAMDGLKETLTNKLQPAFDKVSKIGIKAVSGVADMIDKIDFSALADKVIGVFSRIGKAASGFWKTFTKTGAVIAVVDAFYAVKGAVDAVFTAMKGAGDGKSLLSLITIKNAAELLGNAVVWAANQVENLATFIQRLDPNIIKLVGTAAGIALTAFLGWKSAIGIINGVSGAIKGLSTAFSGVGTALGFMFRHPILSFMIALAAAFVYTYINSEKFRKGVDKVIDALGKAVKAVSDWISKSDGMAGSAAWAVADAVLIYGLYKNFNLLKGSLKSVSGILKTFGQTKGSGIPKLGEDIEKTRKRAMSFKKQLAGGLSFAIKAAGVATVIASLALLAKAMEGIANAGQQAPANLATFGIVVAGLAGTFALFGSKLQASALGIGVFAASVSVLALSLAPIANAGANASANMAMFGIVIGGLVATFAIFGTALNMAIPGMLMFGVTIMMVGAGVLLASAGIAILAAQLPTISAFGLSAAVGLAALGAAAMVLGVGVLIAGVGLVVLAAGLMLVGVGATIAGAGMLILGVATMVFGAALMLVSVAIMITAMGFMMIAGVIPTVAAGFMMLVAPTMMLMVTLPMIGAELLLVGAGAIVAGAGLMLAGAGAVVAGAGMMLLAAGITMVGASLVTLAAGIMALYTTISSIFSQIVSAVMGAMNNVVSTVRGGIDRAISAVQGVAGSLVSAGRDFVMGFVKGITGAIGAAADAAANMAKSAMNAAKKFLGIHSPSRKMRDEVGYFYSAGMAVGINKGSDLVTNSATNVAESAYNAASNVTAPTLDAPTIAGMNLSDLNVGDIMANGFGRAIDALDVLIGKLMDLDGANATIGTSFNNDTPTSGPSIPTEGGSSTTTNGDNNYNFNFGNGSIVVQTSGNETGEELLEKIAAAARKYADKGLSFG